MSSPGALELTRPVSVWNKPLKADFKALFKALSKTAVHGISEDWTRASLSFIDALSAVGLKEDDAPQLGWVLVFRALSRAMFDLVEESKFRLFPGDHDIDALVDELDLSLETSDVTIDAGFFDHPKELGLIAEMATPFRSWLIGAGLEEAAAESVTNRLGTYIVFQLGEEWNRDAKTFAPLKDAFDTPFARAQEVERAWMQYSAWLKRQVDEPLFDEPFGLRQIYVPLRAYWEEKIRDGKGAAGRADLTDREVTVKRTVVQLEDEIADWVKQANRKDAIRVISGGPGSGKSSAAKILAARLAGRSSLRVLYVPLHHFEPGTDLAEALEDFAKEDPYLPAKPLDPKAHGERLLVFFDGLDELAMQGKIAQEVAQKFVREVVRTLDNLNRESCRLQIVLGGRELVIQSNRDEFRQHQLLYLFGYVVPKNERMKYTDPGKLLTRDDRDQWWKRYGKLSGKKHTKLPEPLSGDRLTEVTSQPLLNYLFALSYDRGAVEFTESTSLNVVYRDLLTAVWERGYEGRTHKAIQGLSEKKFLRILEEIALAAWHGDGRTTTVQEIEEHCAGIGLKPILESFQEGAKAGVTRLLTAFYFRQKGHRRSGDKTFEFTHKSFGEYLTARRIARTLKTMHRRRKRREEDPDDGWDERDALKAWAEVCGPTAMERYLFTFVRDEVALQNKTTCRDWQLMIQDLWGFLLRHGMPMERIQPALTFQEQLFQARNAEEGIVAILSVCSRVTGEVSRVDWPSSNAFGDWLKRAQGQRTSNENPLTLACLGYLDLTEQILVYSDLAGAILYGAILDRVRLDGAILDGASLDGASLDGASLDGASLDGASLDGARLDGASLDGASLDGASLDGASLDGASLDRARLVGAELLGASLDRARLDGVRLLGAIFDRASLVGARLHHAYGLTQKQVDSARGDESTTLPQRLKRPKHWTKKY